MAKDKNLTINIRAETEGFNKALNNAKKQTEKLQKNLTSLTKTSTIGFAAVTAVVTATSLSFAKFQKDFTQVVTLLDKSSFSTKSLKEGIKDLETGILDLRIATGESFEDLNKGLFNLISAGVPAEEAITALTIATNLAAAGGTNVAVAVDAITTSINAFGLEASEAERISQLFFLAQKNGKTTVEELASNLGSAASSANSFGISLEEVLAATAATTLAGKTTSASLTGLNAVFSNIAKPTKDAADEAKRLGIQFDSTALRAKGLEGFLNDIVNAEGFTSASIEKLFGSVEAMGVAFALTGEQNKAFTDTLAQLKDETALAETFNNALAESNIIVDKAINKALGALQAITVALGKEFAPIIIAVSEKITDFAKFILNADSGILKIVKNVIVFTGAITGLAAVLGTLGLGLILIRNGLIALSATFGIGATAARIFWLAVSGPIGRIIAAVTAVTGVFLTLKNVFADSPEKDLEKITDELKEIEDKERGLQNLFETGSEKQKQKAAERLEDLRKEKEELESIRDELTKNIGQDTVAKTLEDRKEKIKELKLERESLADKILEKDSEISEVEANRILAINEEIKALEALENVKNKQTEKEVETAPTAQAEDKEEVSISKTDEIINEKTREIDLKIEQALREAEVLKEIRGGAINEEIEAIRAKNALLAEEDKIKLDNELLNAELKTIGLDEERQAQIEKDLELNEIELENLTEKLLFAQEKEEEARILRAEKQEQEREALEEIREIELENQVEFNEVQKEQLLNHLTGQKQTTDKFLLDNINTKKKNDQLAFKNQEKFGKTIGGIVTKFEKQRIKTLKDGSKKEVESFAQTTSRLTALTRSKNAGLAAIGKIAALVQIGVDTAKGAIAAYASLSGIPIVGPALGAAAAGALIAFGAEQAQAVAVSGAVHGGIVNQGQAGVDDQPFLLSRGEAVTPADVTPALLNTFSQLRDIRRSGGLSNLIAEETVQPPLQTNTMIGQQQVVQRLLEDDEPQEIGIVIDFEDDAADIITARQRENDTLSIGTTTI